MQLEQLSIKLAEYIKEKGLSQNAFAKHSNVSASYVTHILKGNFTQIPAGRDAIGNQRYTSVSPDIIKKIKRAMGIADEGAHWPINNYDAIEAVLLEAKAHKEHRIISGMRGSGKTYTVDAFCANYPHETFKVTCSDDMNPKRFMVKLAEALGLDSSGDRFKIRERIASAVIKMENPIIIIDEAENLRMPSYGSIKALFDQVEKDCAIVLVGAKIGDLEYCEALKLWAEKGRGCIAQVYSRFSAEPIILQVLSLEDTALICGLNGIKNIEENTTLIRSLFARSADYRELDRNIKRLTKDRELMAA